MAKALSSMTVEHTITTHQVDTSTLNVHESATEGAVLICTDANTGHGVWAHPTLPDSRPQLKNAADPTKQVRMECSALSSGTTRVIHVPDADGFIPNQPASTTSVPSFAGIHLPVGAVVGYVLTCDNASTGNFVPLPAPGGSGMSLPFDDTTPLMKSSYDSSKRMRFDLSSIMTGTTRNVYMPNADVILSDQDTRVTATPTFTGLRMPTGANLGYYARCDDNTTGRLAWMPPVSVETVTSTPCTIANTSLATEIVAQPSTEPLEITLPVLSSGPRRVIVVRNTSPSSGGHNVVLHAQGTDHIWNASRTELILPGDTFTKLEAAVESGLWLPV